MRLNPSTLISALCWTAQLATAVQVYTFDPASLPSDETAGSRTLSPAEARLVLAQRAGVEDYHLDDLLTVGGIDAINAFGVQQSLFGGKRNVRRRLQILVQVEDDGESIIDAKETSHFTVSPSPSSQSTLSLFLDLARQRWPSAYSHLSDSDILASLEKATASHDQAGNEKDDAFFHVQKPSMHDFERFWQDLITLAHERAARSDDEFTYSLTAIVIPSSSSCKESSKAATWGSYTMPRPQSTTTTLTPNIRKRQQNSPRQTSNSTRPLPGILPSCFSTLDSCISTTRNCTGHGSCTLAYTDPSHEEADMEPCYSCSCRPSIITSTDSAGNERTRTVVWAGPACQKRDVSTSFWLLAGLTVALVFLVSFAVGSLMGCGEEGLPSVIGAGVSGAGVRGRS